MALPVITNCYRCAFEWNSSDDAALNATNVMHFVQSGTDPASLAALIDAHVTATMWSQTAEHCHVNQINITPLDGSGVSFPFVTGSGTKYSGEVTGGSIIPQVATIIKMLTSQRGRSFRGRIFLPFTCEEVLSIGNIAGATITQLNTAWVAFHNAMHSAGAELAVASYKLASARNVVAVTAEPLSGTIRRRQKR